MARVLVSFAGLDRVLRRQITSRARRALQLYRRERRVYDEAGYPFAKRPEDGSIRDPQRSSVRPIRGGVRISVRTRGAAYLEAGNQRGGQYIRGDLSIPLRGGAARAKRRFARGKVVVVGGKPYLAVQRVKTYEGKRALERAVERAFGMRTRVRWKSL